MPEYLRKVKGTLTTLVNAIRDSLSSTRGVKPSALNKALGVGWSLPGPSIFFLALFACFAQVLCSGVGVFLVYSSVVWCYVLLKDDQRIILNFLTNSKEGENGTNKLI